MEPQHRPAERDDDGRGFALITVLMLAALMASLIGGYFALTYIEIATTRANMEGTRGFYSAEAGLNIRADALRQRFLGYERPSGTSPTDGGATPPCESGNLGSGDFACDTQQLEFREAQTWVAEDPANPQTIVIPRGEPYQNLSADQYSYRIVSVATGPTGATEAVLELQMKSRLVPLFQFAVFYNKDLEILPGSSMTLSGPVHTNRDLYVGTKARLDFESAISISGRLYAGEKDANLCPSGDVRVADPAAMQSLPACSSGRDEIVQSQLGPWNGQVRTGVETVTVPSSTALEPIPGQIYWDRADLRLELDVNVAPPVVQVVDANGIPDPIRTADIQACTAGIDRGTTHDFREGGTIELLDVKDLGELFDCIHNDGLLDGVKTLDDATDGGLVLHLTVDGPFSNVVNRYGVRIAGGHELASSSPSAPPIRGLTIVTDQALYVQGDFNVFNKKPAAFLTDSMNVLSNDWDDANADLALTARVASATTINAAILAGTDLTGGADGPAGQDVGGYNGGFENFVRLHEDWTGKRLTLRGSFVSLYPPQHVDGTWDDQSYDQPLRSWNYDTDFDSSANLPPLSPRFVYLRQELFVRRFDL